MVEHDSPRELSRFEHIFSSCPPVLEMLLLNLPTLSIFDLYHTSSHLRRFLQSYPLAFKNLSFRLLLAPPVHPSGTESPDLDEARRPYALDHLLRFGLPSTSCLVRLDLDNTSVSGTELHSTILSPGRATLQHLSVRGCKDVSIKYHILPFLHMQMSTPPDLFGNKPLALKSLYTYRCRHHRRRPYLPQSLNRKDSDSQPTHQLIDLCHRLGIWTDTAWCPSPGSRCHRRKEYFIGRGAMGADEVWVPFDRLWRSHNVVGSVREPSGPPHPLDHGVGRLWEDNEYGFGGEALGCSMDGSTEGKEVPTHLRASHRAFVEGYKCHACGDAILERCEQCSIRMHCMGCRKTLCHSCAFDRPVRRQQRRTRASRDLAVGIVLASALGSSGGSSIFTHSRISRRPEQHRRRDPFWWAPGATRSPNLMREANDNDGSGSDSDDTAGPIVQPPGPVPAPRLDMHWCCLKPSFSGGGGLQFLGTPCGDNVRASPLPQGRGFEDPDFSGFEQVPSHVSHVLSDAESHASESSLGSLDSDQTDLESSVESVPVPAGAPRHFNVLPYLESTIDPNDPFNQRYSSPRSLCSPCYNSQTWKIPCAACHYPICIEHDLKRLKARRCGLRRLSRERENIQAARGFLLRGDTIPRHIADAGVMTFLVKWRPIVASMLEGDRERRVQGKWAPSEEPNRPSERHRELPTKVFSSIITKEDLALPELSMPSGRGRKPAREDGLPLGDHDGSTPRSRIWLSRTQSFSAVPYSKPAFPPVKLSEASSSKMSVSFLLNPTPANLGREELVSTADSVPKSVASTAFCPPWTGCGSYLCAAPRHPGDPRPTCGARDTAQYCSTCGVLVCPGCISDRPPCSCKNCSGAFHCPNCREDPRIKEACTHFEDLIRELQEPEASAADQNGAANETGGMVEVLEEEDTEDDDDDADDGAPLPFDPAYQGLMLDGVSDFWAIVEGVTATSAADEGGAP